MKSDDPKEDKPSELQNTQQSSTGRQQRTKPNSMLPYISGVIALLIVLIVVYYVIGMPSQPAHAATNQTSLATTITSSLIATTIEPGTTTIIPQNLVVYTASTCNQTTTNTVASCSVTESSDPGIFCWSAAYGTLGAPAWPVFNSARAGIPDVAQTGSALAGGSTCTASLPDPDGTPVQVAGLSVNSSGAMMYAGEGGATSNGVSSFSFTYSTDQGAQPEAVALMLSCGYSSCGYAINWPSGCNQIFLTPAGYDGSVALALCDQNESSSYTVSDYNLGSPDTGIAFSYAKFKDGTWQSS